MPSPDSGDDLVGIFGPYQGLWVGIGIRDEAVDRTLEFLQGTEDTASEAPLGKERKQAFDRVEPGCRGWCKMKEKSGMLREPFQDIRVLMGCVIIDDDVNSELSRHSGLDHVEEADELLMPVALHTLADDLAFEDVEGSEQCGGAVPL